LLLPGPAGCVWAYMPVRRLMGGNLSRPRPFKGDAGDWLHTCE
jgi:hypothetical protein